MGAAGNAGPQGPPPFPATLPSVLAVTATDARDRLYPEASRGESIALAAPGVEVYTTVPGGGFAFAHGTSLAAAHVSGVLALLLAGAPGTSGRQLRAVLEETARDLGPPGKDPLFGSGLVDACQALRRLTRERVACPPLEPERRAGQEPR